MTSEVQGVRRTVSEEALVTLAIVRDLHERLGVPIGRAIDVAERVPGGGRLDAGEVILVVDRAAIEQRLTPRIEEAVERVVPRRRGRPPSRPSGP